MLPRVAALVGVLHHADGMWLLIQRIFAGIRRALRHLFGLDRGGDPHQPLVQPELRTPT